MDSIKLLVIEDDLIDQRTIKRALSKSFLNVNPEFISSLKEVDEKLSQEWDLIITDYHLPHNNGVEVLKYLKDQKGLKIPILVMTGVGSEGIANEAMEAGAFDFLTKNLITPEGIGLAVRNAIRVSKKQSETDALLERLKENELQLVETQKIAGLGSWEFDFINDVLIWSEQTFKIFGRNKDKGAWTHDDYINSVIEEDRDLLIEAINNALHKKLSYEVTVRHLKDDTGELIYVSGRGVPYVENGKVTKLHGTLMDVTKQKEVESELINARLVAENMARIKQDFLANMSHEIRTPMNAILGFTDILMEQEISDPVKKNVHKIKQASNNLLVIVNDILDYSKIDAGQLEIESVKFNIKKCLEDAVDQLEPLASKKNLRLFLKIYENIPSLVEGDSVRLTQVLINLVNNAIKFTKKGFVEIRVGVEEKLKDGVRLKFEIEDTGIGIQKSKQAKIFESFTQATSDTTRNYGGTGLGLAICKNLVELQKGKIWLESELGVGSIFNFTIDFGSVDESPKESVSELNIEDVDLSGTKLLLVEDNQMNRELASHFLNQWNVSFEVAQNGLECLEILKSTSFDLILMDLSMPVMDGYTATEKIRSSSDSYSQVPIIAMTANAFSSDIEKCFDLGMNDHISKPFKALDLKVKINNLVRGEKQLFPKINRNSSFEGGLVNSIEPLISLETLKDMGNGDMGFVRDMINIYQSETPITLGRISKAIENADQNELKSAVHKFRSPAALLGISLAVDLAEFIELNVFNEDKTEEVEIAIKKLLRLANQSLVEVENLRF